MNKRFINKKFKYCHVCNTKREIFLTRKLDFELGCYYCPSCKSYVKDSFVLLDRRGGSCRIAAKKDKAFQIFNSLPTV